MAGDTAVTIIPTPYLQQIRRFLTPCLKSTPIQNSKLRAQLLGCLRGKWETQRLGT